MYKYPYEAFDNDVNTLLQQTKSYNPDIILAVARGGVTLGHFMANRMDIRALFTLNSVHYEDTKKLETIDIFNIPNLGEGKRVLVVDDIVDSGESMQAIFRVLKEKFPHNVYKSAVLFYKPEAILTPDFKCHEAKEWIEFFWD